MIFDNGVEIRNHRYDPIISEDFDFIEKLISKPPSLNISFLEAWILRNLQSQHNWSVLGLVCLHPHRCQTDCNSTIIDIFIIRVILKGRFLLGRKEIILLRVVEEPALGSRGLTRRTFPFGSDGMVKDETAAGKEATCA
ncbi:hypothetical protein TNCV_3373161 [Trichonephila clavipes]|nr:hypothetical protein TNCV_3373161 [Trichonephila clavipes]